MKVLACGDRNWDDLEGIRAVLDFMGPSDTLIHGNARGADSLAHFAASELGCTIETYTADWKKLGKSAGPIRNQQMLDEGKPDVVFAFHDDLASSKGTKDMVLRARKAELRVFLAEHNDEGKIVIGTTSGPLLDNKLIITDPVLREIRDILL